MQEIWKKIPNWEFYEVSNLGNVRTSIRVNRNSKHGNLREVKTSRMSKNNGYRVFCISDGNGNRKTMSLHRAILMSFVGVPEEEKIVARHIDGNSHNNTLENLCWGTYSENQLDAVNHGTSHLLKVKGENVHGSKLTKSDVIEILSLRGVLSERKIAEKYGVKQSSINKILNRQTWRHINV